ncbi:MAG TPA: RelA/SpoT family protein, partial [Patescibacteria group bacterium]|nr:RelA/SpoT family protein [Patescibacteria group bacterium]
MQNHTNTLTKNNLTIRDLLRLAKKNNLDVDLIQLAYEFAEKAHKNQKRKSGEPYIVHPLAVAYLLVELGLDSETVAAGLLHDVPEDTPTTLHEIKKEFGKEIAFLVKGITKLGLVKYRGVDRYVENLRHMFIAMAEDVRVVLMKFADRIHNLQTLQALPPEKRRRIALESIEIYAPIANRLGMGEIRGQLEDLSFPYLYPEEYAWLMKKFGPHLKEKEELIQQLIAFLQKEFKKHHIPIVAIHGRTKHLYSLYQKLLCYNRDITKIYDLVALRLIVKDVSTCYESLGIIHEFCKPLKGRIKDYISQPKPNGYRSLHTTVFMPPQFAKDEVHGEIVEIQIRTKEMHNDAEFGIAAHWKYKEEDHKEVIADHRLDWMRQIVEIQKEVQDDQLLETLKIDVFQNYIFVFTPLGDVIELPEDATPVDFAYQIHTDLGDKCCGVKINDQIGSLNS